MKIDLKKYMTQRDQLRTQKKDPGPLVTLSRQYGCEANDVTLKLLTRINNHLKQKSVNAIDWKYISKEIIEEAAKELKLPEERIEQRVIQHQENGMLDAMFSSLSTTRSLTDKTIIKKVNEIIQTYAHNGRVIIIGRGGVLLTRGVAQSIHVRIFAPYDWRVASIAEKHQLSQMEAEHLVKEQDQSRVLWTEHLTGQSFDEYVFDVLLNRSTMSTDEMVNIIFHMMIKRQLV